MDKDTHKIDTDKDTRTKDTHAHKYTHRQRYTEDTHILTKTHTKT